MKQDNIMLEFCLNILFFPVSPALPFPGMHCLCRLFQLFCKVPCNTQGGARQGNYKQAEKHS